MPWQRPAFGYFLGMLGVGIWELFNGIFWIFLVFWDVFIVFWGLFNGILGFVYGMLGFCEFVFLFSIFFLRGEGGGWGCGLI